MVPDRANSMRCLTVAILALLSVCTTALAQNSFVYAHTRSHISIPFKMVKSLVIIPIMVNDKGPYNFVLDTGVGMILFTDPSLIDSLNITFKRDIKIKGFGEGGDLSAYITGNLKMNVTEYIQGSFSAAFLKDEAFDLSGYTGMPVHGLIGYEFFNSFTVKINYSGNTLTLYRPDAFYVPKKGFKIPINIEDRKPYLETAVTLQNGKSILTKLIIDTGAGHPLSLETNEGLPFELPEKHVEANLGVGLAGPITGFVARVKSLKIGKFELNKVTAAFPDYKDVASKLFSINRHGNLGNYVLKRFDVVFDYKRECLYLKKGIYFKEPFEHDMSGLELASAGPDLSRIIVSRVEKSSPGEEVNLKEGDEIVSVNFKPVSELGVEAIANMLQSGNERSLLLQIIPKGEKRTKNVIITLKKRV